MQAYRCGDVNKVIKCEPAIGGQITIDRTGQSGRYELEFSEKDKELQTGDFQVTECMTRIVCR